MNINVRGLFTTFAGLLFVAAWSLWGIIHAQAVIFTMLCGVAAAAAFFVVRSNYLFLYGVIEVAIGLAVLPYKLGELGDDSSAVDFSSVHGSVFLLRAAVAIYLMVRGIGNVDRCTGRRLSRMARRSFS